MKTITAAEVEGINERFYNDMNDLMDALVEKTVAPLRGRKLRGVRNFKDPVTGRRVEREFEVTITGGEIGPEWSLALKGTYVHPFSGLEVETIVG